MCAIEKTTKDTNGILIPNAQQYYAMSTILKDTEVTLKRI